MPGGLASDTHTDSMPQIPCFISTLPSPPIKCGVARILTYPQVLVSLVDPQWILPQESHDVLHLLAHWAAGDLPRRRGGSRTATHRGRARRLRTRRADEEAVPSIYVQGDIL